MSTEEHEIAIQTSLVNFEEIIERLGFWPSQSAVARWFGESGEIFVQRMDWPEEEGLTIVWLEEFLRPARVHGPQSVEIWISCSDTYQCDTHILITLSEAISELEIEVLGASVIDQNRMRSASCHECLAEHPWNPEPHLLTLAESRTVLEHEFSYRSELGLSAKVISLARENLNSESDQLRHQEVEYLHHLIGVQETLADSGIARVATALQHVRIRDAFLWDIAAGQISNEAAAECLSSMLPHITGDLVMPIATVAATCWWVSGNGAKANMCLERVKEGSCGYGLATLVQAALRAGLAPRFWVETVMELDRAECLDGGKVA